MAFFDSFEVFGALGAENSTVQLVYGVNVVRVEAEVAAARTATVGELVELYRDQLHLPENAVVFVDGVQAEASTPLPSTPCRVEVVKDAGIKGSEKPIIPLLPEEAATITVYRQNLLTVISEDVEELGVIDHSLVAHIQFTPGTGVVRQTAKKAVVGRTIATKIGTKIFVDEEFWATRRPDGVITTDDLLPEGCTEAHLCGEGWTSRPVIAGDCIFAFVPGKSRKVSLPEWEAYFTAELEKAFAGRRDELDALPLKDLKTLAKAANVKVSGEGRSRETITSDLLVVERKNWIEFNGLDPEDEIDIDIID